MDLNKLLRDQKQELEGYFKTKKIIEREAGSYFKNLIDSKLIKVISGVRRCGKSVFSYMALRDKNFAYMNFDDERLVDLRDANEVLSSFYEIYGRNLKFIFLDEIQNLEKWELFVNRLKRMGFNLFITGSNARLLSKELASNLTGRHLTIDLFPFSFKEYLKAIDFNEDTQSTRGNSFLKRELQNYMANGGFPEIVVEKENPKLYLRELYSKIIEKDIIGRYGISYKKTFKEISMNLISNPARHITYNKLKKQFNIKSEHTIKNYISYLEEAYLIFILSRFSYKPVEIEKSEKKVYVIDTGIINNLSYKFSKDIGRMYENLVAIELLRRKSFNLNFEVFYWKNVKHEEVDFVLKENLKIKQLIQVCYDLEDLETKERELKALIKASKELRCNDLIVINENVEKEEMFKNKRIKFIPLWKWLLD